MRNRATTATHLAAAASPAATMLPGMPGSNELNKQFAHVVPTMFVKMESAKLAHRKDVAQLGRACRDAQHTVTFAIQQRGLGELSAIVDDVSNPLGPNFGKHLTRVQVREMTANPQSTAHVKAFFGAKDGVKIVHETKGGEFLTATASVRTWEKMFDTKFFEFVLSRDTVHRALEYSLPSALVGHVAHVFNVVDFVSPGTKARPDKKEAKTAAAAEADTAVITAPNSEKEKVYTASDNGGGVLVDGYVTVQFINDYYLVFNNTGSMRASQAVFEGINQSYSPSDLTDFQTTFELPIEAVAYNVGGHAHDNACLYAGGSYCAEGNLDLQYMMGLSQNTPTTYYYWNDTSADVWTTFIVHLADIEDPPLVFSISYDTSEATLSAAYMETWNTEAMKLSATGVTFVSSSGDDGVAGYMARTDPEMCGYWPMFPSSSRYTVSMGGTMGPAEGSEEMVCQSDTGGVITTGGGFSTLEGQQPWQAEGIAAYLAYVGQQDSADAPVAGYASGGRGYPDLAAFSADYLVTMNGVDVPTFGTSASSPVFAAMVSLVNSARIDAGKSSLGWINPSIWTLHDSFILNDITSGINNCAASGYICCSQGFSAVPGWDPSTGWGSVNFTAFYNVFFALGDDLGEPTMAPSALPGAPTTKPSKAPSAVPTEAPTESPTSGAGYVYFTTYEEFGCSDSAATSIGAYFTNVCLPAYSTTNRSESVSYVKHSCGDIYSTMGFYSDSDCSDEYLLETLQYFLGCATVDPSYYGTYEYGFSAMCTSDVADLPIASGSDYVQLAYYTDNECDSIESSSLTVLNQWCFDAACDVDNEINSCSYMYDWPNLNSYAASGCNTAPTDVTTLSSECTVSPNDDEHLFLVTNELFVQYSFLEVGDADSNGNGGSSDDDAAQALATGLGVTTAVLFVIIAIGAFFWWKNSKTGSVPGDAGGGGVTLKAPLTNNPSSSMAADTF
jgi:tripeptidyl-peptidase I